MECLRSLPEFVMACMTGDRVRCAMHLEACVGDRDKLKKLVERRYTILRLPALFLTLIGSRTFRRPSGAELDGHVGVAELLIEKGHARVDALDLCGKTILQYACGLSVPRGAGRWGK